MIADGHFKCSPAKPTILIIPSDNNAKHFVLKYYDKVGTLNVTVHIWLLTSSTAIVA